MLREQLLRQSRGITRSLSQSARVAQPSSSKPLISRRSYAISSILPRHVPLSYNSTSYSLNRRWQSTEAAANTDAKSTQSDAGTQTSDSSTSTGTETSPEAENPLKAELDKSKKEAIDLKDKYLRSVADFRNLQERTKRDMESARQFAIQRFATDILDSIDNLDRALSSVPAAALGKSSTTSGSTSNTSSADPNHGAATENGAAGSQPNQDLLNLHSGLKMTESILLSTLKKHGLERFDPSEGTGRKFDPNTDEATFFTKVEGKQDGDVFYTQSKGFKLNGRVIRAAKVGVVKNS